MVQRKVIVRGVTDQALDELDAADIPDLSAAYEAAGGIATHAADTSSIHGITDTTVLATDAEVATAVSDHAAAANPHATYLTQAEGDAAYEAAGGIATHSADTTDVHGIVDTSDLSLTSHDHDADYEAAGGIATHAGLADPHTGYRLESADHSHATTGLQGGTVAHTALTSVGVDDHHARDHAINGSIHSGTLDDAQIPAGIARDAEVAAAYQPLDSDLTAIAALTTTAFGRALLELADAAALGAGHSHSGGSPLYAPGTFTVPTGNFKIMADLLELTGVEVGTLEGTAVLALI